jgi:hypothetical protein
MTRSNALTLAENRPLNKQMSVKAKAAFMLYLILFRTIFSIFALSLKYPCGLPR